MKLIKENVKVLTMMFTTETKTVTKFERANPEYLVF